MGCGLWGHSRRREKQKGGGCLARTDVCQKVEVMEASQEANIMSAIISSQLSQPYQLTNIKRVQVVSIKATFLLLLVIINLS